MTHPPLEVDIVIIGSGPVGSTLAIDLSLKGVSCALVDREDKDFLAPQLPKCNRINSRSMEHFRRLGLADTLRMHGLPLDHPTDLTFVTSITGYEIVRFRHRSIEEVLKHALVGSVEENWPTPEPPHMLSQLYLEPLLRNHVRKHSLCTRISMWEYCHFTQDDSGVSCLLRSIHAPDKVRIIRGKYLIACDGGRSEIRKQLGVALSGQAVVTNYRTTFFRSTRLRQVCTVGKSWMFRIKNELTEGILISIDGVDLWTLHIDIGPGLDTPYNFVEQLKSVVNAEVDCDIIRQESWVARAMVADKYSHGRVFLCGDAAHIWIPLAGFGMNIGIEDACNLAWKLANVVKQQAQPSLLDTYEEERRPVGMMVAAAVASIRAASTAATFDVRCHESTPEAQILRQQLGEKIRASFGWEANSVGLQLGLIYESSIVARRNVPGANFSLDTYKESCTSGCRLPHLQITEKSCLFDMIGPGFTLILIGDKSKSREDFLLTELAMLSTPVSILSLETNQKFEQNCFVLVRPDQYIAWSSEELPPMQEFRVILERCTRSVLFK